MTKADNITRQNRFVKRRDRLGLVRLAVWVPKIEAHKIRELARELMKGKAT